MTTGPNCPLFKTTRRLGGRALMSDRFGKPGRAATTYPGDGVYIHKDGYNVLYGDYHAAFYGDPQGKVAWGPALARTGTAYSYDKMGSNNVRYANSTGYAFNTVRWHLSYGAYYMHIFDVSAGIDVDVDYTVYDNLPFN